MNNLENFQMKSPAPSPPPSYVEKQPAEEIHHESKLDSIIDVLHHDVEVLSDLKKDISKILFLIYIYFLQRIPLGLTASIPFLLADYTVDYSQQGTFSFANWPFSVKLLWAPLVDAIYIRRFGRRKSWLVPVQLLIGILMISLAGNVQTLIRGEKGHTGNKQFQKNHLSLFNLIFIKDIIWLTLIFVLINMLAATLGNSVQFQTIF